MKILIIRHGEVDMKWEKSYNAVTFDEACKNYDICGIKHINKKIKINNKYKIYISELSRTKETALQLFGENNFYSSELLNEVPLKSFMDTKRKFPLIIWNVIGRLQWMTGNIRQPEVKVQTAKRAEKAVLMLERNNEDCYVVTHGFFARIFLRELEKRGFRINKKKIKINNLDEIIAYK